RGDGARQIAARGAAGDQVGIDRAAVGRGGVEEADLRRALVGPVFGFVDRGERRRAGIRVGDQRETSVLLQRLRQGGDGGARDPAAHAEGVAALVQIFV